MLFIDFQKKIGDGDDVVEDVMKIFMKMMMTVMMMLMIRKKLSHRCFWRNINCCARGGLFQAIPEDGDGDGDDGTGR